VRGRQGVLEEQRPLHCTSAPELTTNAELNSRRVELAFLRLRLWVCSLVTRRWTRLSWPAGRISYRTDIRGRSSPFRDPGCRLSLCLIVFAVIFLFPGMLLVVVC